ncbi:MAG: hypothetical protein LBM95_08795 [Lactobacillales bacterium]|nr:hypothetical protein [Lactobacillales bacterium]
MPTFSDFDLDVKVLSGASKVTCPLKTTTLLANKVIHQKGEKGSHSLPFNLKLFQYKNN